MTLPRHQVVAALRASAKALSAGTVAYPPKMYAEIKDLLVAHFASAALHVIRNDSKDLQQELSILRPGEGAVEIEHPKLSPAVWKMVRSGAEILLSDIDVYTADPEQAQMYDGKSKHRGSPVTRLRDLSEGRQGKVNPGVRSGDTPRFDADVQKSLLRITKAKSFDGMSIEDMRLVAGVLFAVAYNITYSTAAEKAMRVVAGHLRDLRDMASRKENAVTGDPQKIAKLVSQIEENNELEKFMISVGAKPVKKLKALEDVAHSIKMDLTGLPASYPRDIVDSGDYDKLTVRLRLLTSSTYGSYSHESREIQILAGSLGELGEFVKSKAKFADFIKVRLNTLKHELQHMMQYAMRDSLRLREQQRIGGPVQRGGPWDQAGSPYRKPDREGHVNRRDDLQKVYPDATQEDLYFLSPIEFFPQIDSAIHQILRMVRYSPYSKPPSYVQIQKQAKPLWRAFTGSGPAHAWLLSRSGPFYAALKKHNPKGWKRAVSEGWVRFQKELKDRVAEEAAGGEAVEAALRMNLSPTGNAKGRVKQRRKEADVAWLEKAVLAAITDTYAAWSLRGGREPSLTTSLIRDLVLDGTANVPEDIKWLPKSQVDLRVLGVLQKLTRRGVLESSYGLGQRGQEVRVWSPV